MNTEEINEIFDIDPQIAVLNDPSDPGRGRGIALSGTETTASGSCGPTMCFTQC